ncbi:MAG: hypothetical protein K6G15_01375 [Desulfovibrio sp.]|nr:hypothetical protein [Desulfovibrio sp.]
MLKILLILATLLLLFPQLALADVFDDVAQGREENVVQYLKNGGDPNITRKVEDIYGEDDYFAWRLRASVLK